MASTRRMAEFRRMKKEEGFKESTIWLSPEDLEIVERRAEATGLPKAEIIRMALKTAYAQETPMTAG